MKRSKKESLKKGIILSEEELEKILKELKNWKVEEGKLQREYTFSSFVEAFGFMTAAAILSESMNHRMEWYNNDQRVVVKLRTHSVGGITTIDVL